MFIHYLPRHPPNPPSCEGTICTIITTNGNTKYMPYERSMGRKKLESTTEECVNMTISESSAHKH